MPTQVAQAASPFMVAVLLDRFGTTATLAVLCAEAVVNIGLALALVPHSRRR